MIEIQPSVAKNSVMKLLRTGGLATMPDLLGPLAKNQGAT